MANKGIFEKIDFLERTLPVSAIGDYAQIVDSGLTYVYTKNGWVQGFPLEEVRHFGQLRLLATTDTLLATAETYYKIAGLMGDGYSRGFTVENNQLIYNSIKKNYFLFNGASDLQVNKLCELTYSLYKNDVLVTGAQTPHTFVA